VVEVYGPPAWTGDWPEIGAVVRVTRSGHRDGAWYERTGLYVTSRTGDACTLGEAIRSHWHEARGPARGEPFALVQGRASERGQWRRAVDEGSVGAVSAAWCCALGVAVERGVVPDSGAVAANRVGAMVALLRT
jgi:hypothetical protein